MHIPTYAEMAEALGGIASVLTVIESVAHVTKIILSRRNASGEARRLVGELSHVFSPRSRKPLTKTSPRPGLHPRFIERASWAYHATSRATGSIRLPRHWPIADKRFQKA
jgi:hypothetical protein